MQTREMTPFGQRMTRQSKNILKLIRLYNATLDKKHLDKALKLREKYIQNANRPPITITSTDTATA